MRKELLVILLFIFFISFSCASTPVAVEEETVTSATNTSPISTNVTNDAEEKNVESNALWLPSNTFIKETDRGKLLVFDENIIFKFGSSNLPKNADYILAIVLKNILNNNPNIRIVVEAHTSNRGIAYPYNYDLSVRRLNSAFDYLQVKCINTYRLIKSPLSEVLPKSTNVDENRRLEFIIVENEDGMKKYMSFLSNVDVKKETTLDEIKN